MKIPDDVLISLSRAGFYEIKEYKNSRVFSLSNVEQDKDFRFFSPHILSYDDGKSLAGIIGLMRSPSLGRLRRGAKNKEDYIITCYTANFSLLRLPPIIGRNEQDDLRWCKSILSVVKEFPKDHKNLLLYLKSNVNICGFKISDMNIF